MLDFGLRNLTIFWKDKTTVLLSFLAEFIIVGLYALFLRDNLLQSFAQLPQADLLMDLWMVCGILAITSVTTTMGAYGVMVEDKAKKIYKDFYTSPVRKTTLLGGYMFSAGVIGLVMSVVIFLLAQVYVSWQYGFQLNREAVLCGYAILVLVTFTNSSLVLFVVSFLQSNNALAVCCTLIGALIGFLTGIYLPVGNLPASVQWVVKAFPVSHGVSLLRQALMQQTLAQSFGPTGGQPCAQFETWMGVRFSIHGTVVEAWQSTVYLLITGAVFLGLAAWNLCRSKPQ